MLKHHPDAFVVSLAVTSGDKDLYTNGKAHCQGGEYEIIQTRHHGGTQLVGTEMAHKSSIGEGDDSLRQVTQHDGVRDAPDFAIGDGSLNHVTKVGIFLSLFQKKCIFAPCNGKELRL